MLWPIVGLPILVLLAGALGFRWQVVWSDRGSAARDGRGLIAAGADRVMAVVAHPDDLEYFAGGTLARLIERGARVTAVVATDGEKGGRRRDLARIRRGEQRRAAEILGYRRVLFLGLADRGVRNDAGLRNRLSRVLASEHPQIVFTFDDGYPLLPYIHPDHQAVGRATRAVWPGPLLLFHTRRPNLAVDVREVTERKAAAIRAHQSQASHDHQRHWVRAFVRLAGTWPFRRLLPPAYRGEGSADEEWFRRV